MEAAVIIGQTIQRQRVAQGLTQEQLARRAEVPYTTLTKVESGAIRNPSAKFVGKVCKALNVSLDTILAPRSFVGKDALQKLWNDVLETMKSSGEYMCISGIQESQFLNFDKKKLLAFIESLRVRGFKQKLISCEGDENFLDGEHLEYRWIPKKYFNAIPMYVYADRIAFLVWGPPEQVIIIQNEMLADTYRKQFLFIWEHATPVNRKRSKRR